MHHAMERNEAMIRLNAAMPEPKYLPLICGIEVTEEAN